MGFENLTVWYFSLLAVVLMQQARKITQLDRWPIVVHGYDTRPIAVCMVLLNNLANLFVVVRQSPVDLSQGDLSSSNFLTVVASAAAALLSLYMLLVRKSIGPNLISGPSFWLLSLFLLYFASSFWSMFPEGTMYRSVELFAQYVAAIYIFTGRNPLRSLYWILAADLLLAAISLAPLALESLAKGEVFGFIRSNQHSLYAALFLLLTYHLHRNSIPAYLYGLFMLVGFGSASTLAAFLVAIAIYAMYGRGRGLLFALRVPIMAAMVAASTMFIFFPEFYSGIIDFLAPVLQKDVRSFYNASGRIEIWQGFLASLADYPLGIGFWAERSSFLYDAFMRLEVEWLPGNTHNGFLSAFVGAGIPALVLLIAIYASLVTYLHRQDLDTRRIGYPIVAMLFINSMTYAGIGGTFSMWYYVLAAVVVLSNLPVAGRVSEGISLVPARERALRAQGL
jgi:O-antigen ligase